MLERLGLLLRPQTAPRRVFIAVFAAVFLLVVATSTLVTFIMPGVLLQHRASLGATGCERGDSDAGNARPGRRVRSLNAIKTQLELDSVRSGPGQGDRRP